MENEYVLPFELKEEEGKNDVHLEDEYYEEETIEFFKILKKIQRSYSKSI